MQLDTESVRVLNTIQRVRNLPNFQGYLDFTELNTIQAKRAYELCGQHIDARYCLFGIVDGQVSQIVHPDHTHLIALTEASDD